MGYVAAGIVYEGQLAVIKEINIVDTRNTNKEEMLDSLLTFINSTRSKDIISPNTIIEFFTY